MLEKRSTGPDPSRVLFNNQTAGRPAGQRFRVNWKAAAAILLAGSVAAIGLRVFVVHQGRTIHAQVLADARRLETAGEVDLAIRHLNLYLATHPLDIPVLDRLSRIMAENARTIPEAMEAANLNDRLLRLDSDGPGRQETRRRVVDLYVRCGDAHRASAIYRLMPDEATYELRYRKAEATARDLFRRGETRPSDHRLLASALEGLAVPGDRAALDGAITHFEEALRGDPTDVVSAERLARLCQERLNDPTRAEAVLDTLIRANPRSDAARLVRYRYFTRTRRKDRASEELEAATRLAPDNLDVRLSAAGDAIRRGDTIVARRHLTAVPAWARGDLRVRVALGLVDFNEERPEEAISGWRQGLLAIGGSDADLTWWLAHTLILMGRVSEAQPLVAQYRRIEGPEALPLARLLQAELDERTGRPTRAIVALEWARDRVGEAWQSMVFLALGRCYEAIADEKRALAAYRRAGQADPRAIEPRMAIARLLARKPDEAIREIEGGLSRDPDDPSLWVALASARLNEQLARPPANRDWTAFDRDLARASQLSPENSSLVMLRADRLRLAGDPAGALRLLEASAGRSPRNLAIWMSWATGLARTGHPEEALRVLDRAAGPEAVGDRALLRMARAQILASLGRGREARDILVRDDHRLAVGDRPLVWEFLGKLDGLLGDVSGARSAFARWAELRPDDPRPRLALLELAGAVGNEAAVRSAIRTLRDSGGPDDIAWKLCRVQEILWNRPGGESPGSAGNGQLVEAVELLDTILLDAPEVPVAHLLRGEVLERLHKDDEAIAAFRRAWDRGSPAGLTRLVEILVRLRRTDELAGLRETATPIRVDSISAMASLRAGDPEAAGRFVDLAVEESGNRPGSRPWQFQMYEALGKPDQAEAVLLAQVEQDPAQLSPWLSLVRYQARRGKAAQASATVDRAMARVQVDNRPLMEASLRWATGDHEAADRAFRAALQARPDDGGVRLLAARHRLEIGRASEAADLLRQGLRANPQDPTIARELALLLSGNPSTWNEADQMTGPGDGPAEDPDGRLARAIVLSRSPDAATRARSVPILDSIVQDIPADRPAARAARDRLIALDREAGPTPRAVELAMVAAASGSNPADISRYIEILLQAGRRDEAIRQVDRLAALLPNDPTVAGYRIRWVAQSASPSEVIQAIESAATHPETGPGAEAIGRAAFTALIAMGPPALEAADRVGRSVARARPSASWMPARVLAKKRQFAEALAQIKGSAASDLAEDRSGAVEVAIEVAVTSENAPDRRPAVESILAEALARDPNHYAILIRIAMFRHGQGQFDEEIDLYRKALRARPADPIASNNLGWILSEGRDRPGEALEIVNASIHRNGWTREILDTRGVILTRLGRFDEAIRDFQLAGGTNPPPSLLFHIAKVYQKSHQDQEFQKYLEWSRRAGIDRNLVDLTERNELDRLLPSRRSH